MRSRPALWIVLVAVVGVGSFVADRRGWMDPVQDTLLQGMTPVQQVLSSIDVPLDGVLGDFQDVRALRSENEQLRRAVADLNAEVVRLRELERNNRQLLGEQEYRRAHPDVRFVSARIIHYDRTSPLKVITIDRGRNDGLQEGFVVVDQTRLVGKLTQVFANSARVLLITDPNSSVNAMVQRSDARSLGVVNGQVREVLVMKYLPQSERVDVGDVVVTSGVGGGFPKGLFVGHVTTVRRSDVDLFQEARVEPAMSMAKLESVMVITNFMPVRLD